MDSFDFKVGPPDDAENFTVMSIGLQARKNALNGLNKVQAAILKSEPECSAKEGIAYAWQGMLSQAAYTIVLTQIMLKEAGLKYNGDDFKLEDLISQVTDITHRFYNSMENDNDGQ